MSRLDTRARQLLKFREAADLAGEEHKRAKAESVAFEQAFLAELDDLGLKSFAMSDGTKIATKSTLYHEAIDNDALHEWAVENGMLAEWFGHAPRKAALNEYVNTAMENSIPLPPGLGTRVNRFLSVTKPPAK